ncbi:hypothetical protein [Metabacillus niabensis]|uniref:hypothetical protein n=1 Tax=Metabacillus niabensis TaxID=324854 RepID=UPI001CF98011|nr:hypothetical protein [Metabacillus niabensis]
MFHKEAAREDGIEVVSFAKTNGTLYEIYKEVLEVDLHGVTIFTIKNTLKNKKLCKTAKSKRAL